MAKVKSERDWAEFNINQKVKVQLTPFGYQHLAEIHNAFLGRIPHWERRDWKYYEDRADSDGYTEFQMWGFMQQFGEVTSLTKPPYFETTILLEF